MSNPFVVIEINENRSIGTHLCKDEDEAVEVFKRIVDEYGVEAYEEMITFPAHFKNIALDHVVLAFNLKSGVVVDCGESLWQVGHFAKNWINFLDTDEWTRVNRSSTFED